MLVALTSCLLPWSESWWKNERYKCPVWANCQQEAKGVSWKATGNAIRRNYSWTRVLVCFKNFPFSALPQLPSLKLQEALAQCICHIFYTRLSHGSCSWTLEWSFLAKHFFGLVSLYNLDCWLLLNTNKSSCFYYGGGGFMLIVKLLKWQIFLECLCRQGLI